MQTVTLHCVSCHSWNCTMCSNNQVGNWHFNCKHLVIYYTTSLKYLSPYPTAKTIILTVVYIFTNFIKNTSVFFSAIMLTDTTKGSENRSWRRQKSSNRLTTSSKRLTPRRADGDCGRLGGALPGWLPPLATTDRVWPCVAAAVALSSSLPLVDFGHHADMSLATLSVSDADGIGFDLTWK